MNINVNEFISSYAFARLSNIVYSEVVTESQYSQLNLKEHTIISRGKNIVFYKINSFELNENDIIFCNLGLVNELFSHLNKINKFNNIKIITNQTDSSVGKKLFSKKPNCVSKWYTINLNYNDPNLISIPLGLSNNYSPKNPKGEDFINLFKKEIKKENKYLYMNFRENTNLNERNKIYNFFKDQDWVHSDEANLSIESYLEQLSKHTFVLCPWGNGYETHRFWETLYAGSVPVLKKHPTYKSSQGLPVLYVEDYHQLTKELLDKFASEMNEKNYNYKKLSMNYWKELIIEKNQNNYSEPILINESKYFISKFLLKNYVKTQINSKSKKIIFLIRQIKKIPYKLVSLIKQ